MTTPEPPPEAKLISQRRLAMVPVVSMREAARRAGFSVATWTQIEQGYRKVTPTVTIPISGTDEKVARMALVTGATPDELRAAARPDAAVILEKLLADPPDPVLDMIRSVERSAEFTERQKAHLIDLLKRESR